MTPDIPIEKLINSEINVMLERLLQEDNETVMRLRILIPSPNAYPWEQFLRLNFSPTRPFVRPYVFKPEDFSRDNGQLLDSAKPRTYYALFRFMEFYRAGIEDLEKSVQLAEDKFRYFKFRNKHALDMRQVDRGDLTRRINESLIAAHNIVSHRGHLENLYRSVVRYVNTEIQSRGEFNLRKTHGSLAMESEHYPDYGVLMIKVLEFLRTQRRIHGILDQWKNIRLPGESSRSAESSAESTETDLS